MEVLLARLSGGITVEIQPTESLDLIQQFDLRQMSLQPNDRKQNECWFINQVDQRIQRIRINLFTDNFLSRALCPGIHHEFCEDL